MALKVEQKGNKLCIEIDQEKREGENEI